VNFKYCLESIGWVDLHLQIGNSEIYIYPSYLSEPLIDLVKSLESLLAECVAADEVKSVVQFDMNSEPAVHDWRIERKSESIIEIEITSYEDEIKAHPGKLEFKEQCSLYEFIEVVVHAMELLLKNHGIIGYRKQWYAQDFPIGSYLQLKYYLLNKSDFPTKTTDTDTWKIESNLIDELKLMEKIIM